MTSTRTTFPSVQAFDDAAPDSPWGEVDPARYCMRPVAPEGPPVDTTKFVNLDELLVEVELAELTDSSVPVLIVDQPAVVAEAAPSDGPPDPVESCDITRPSSPDLLRPLIAASASATPNRRRAPSIIPRGRKDG